MHQGDGFSGKTLRKSRYHFQSDWSGNGPADQFWQMEHALRMWTSIFAPWKEIQDILGFWIPRCNAEFQVLGSGFRIPCQRNLDCGLLIQADSFGFWIPHCGFPRFQVLDSLTVELGFRFAIIRRIPDSWAKFWISKLRILTGSSKLFSLWSSRR